MYNEIWFLLRITLSYIREIPKKLLHVHYYSLWPAGYYLRWSSTWLSALRPGQQSGHSASCNTLSDHICSSFCKLFTHFFRCDTLYVTYLAGPDSSWCRTLHPDWASEKNQGCPCHGGRSRRNHQSDQTPGCWQRPAQTFKDLKGLLERQQWQNTLGCLLIAARESVWLSEYVAVRTYW